MKTSPTASGVAATFFVAVFTAWLFTDPVIAWTGVDENNKEIVAVLLGLTGEQIMRAIILITQDKDFIRRIIERRLGGGDK